MEQEGIDYSGPRILAEIVSQLLANQKNVRILDFGSGTGLAGKWVSLKQLIQ